MEPGDPAVRRQVGWRGRPTTPADLLDWFGRADVTVFASTHTGLPYAQVIPDGRGQRLVVNNGAAGLPNFMDTSCGVFTRLSSDSRPPADSLYGTTIGALRCDAVALRFDLGEWRRRFLVQWPRAALATAPTSPASPAEPICGCRRPHEPACNCVLPAGSHELGGSQPGSAWSRAGVRPMTASAAVGKAVRQLGLTW